MGQTVRTHEVAAPGWRMVLVLVLMLALTTILSQFFRSALAVIAPELTLELGLTPVTLGLANGGFFAALLVAQVLVGVSIDRYGARRTVGALSVLMVAGAAMHAIATDATSLLLARVVTGLGCAASFMSAIILVSSWLPESRWSQGLSWVFGLSQIGILMAGLPLAQMAESMGWRRAFLVMAVVAAVAHILFYLVVSDTPGGRSRAAARPVSQARKEGVLEGLRRVLTIPGVLPVFALFGVAYAATATISGLWAGPFLRDVYGFDARERGGVLTAMAACQMVFVFVYGPLDRVFQSRKRVVMAGALMTLACLTALAMFGGRSATVAVGLLLVMSMVTNYNPLLLSHMRSHFPADLAGRGATTGNIAQLGGAALMPIVTGWVSSGVASGSGSAAAYQAIFATLALTLFAGIVCYVWSSDARSK